MLSFSALTARRETVVCVIKIYAPVTRRAAIVSYSGFLANVIHISLLFICRTDLIHSNMLIILRPFHKNAQQDYYKFSEITGPFRLLTV